MIQQSILSDFSGSVWAIRRELLETICNLSDSSGISIDADCLEMIAGRNRQARAGAVRGSVGVLPIYGIITQRMDLLSEFLGGTSTDRVAQQFDSMIRDPDIKQVVLDVDSPGGHYSGVPELAAKIFSSRGTKPIVAQVNSLAASAAYWIAAAADEIVVTPSGDLGSVGVLAVHYDRSGQNQQLGVKPTYIHYGRFKVEGNEDQPLGDEAYQEIQRRVNEAGEIFTHALARYRGLAAATVRERFGQGRMFGPKEAISRGLADRIGSLDETVSYAADGARRNRRKLEMYRRRFRLAAMR